MNNTNAHCMYFVAIVCPEELNKKIELFKLWMQEKFGCKVALKSPAHITLIPPFWFDTEKENILEHTVSSFHGSTEATEIQLNSFSHFSNRVLYINIKTNKSLNDIRQEAEKYFIKELGNIIKPETRQFTPHITIANRDLKPGDFIKAWEHFSHKKFEEKFTADTISVLKLNEGKWTVIAHSDLTAKK
jgi:2'-5' RNA ligase